MFIDYNKSVIIIILYVQGRHVLSKSGTAEKFTLFECGPANAAPVFGM